MHYLTIGITPSVFALLNSRFSDFSDEEINIVRAVSQQELLLSDGIVAFFRSRIEDASMIETYISRYGNIEGKCRYVIPEEKYTDGAMELIGLVAKLNQKILVGEKTELKAYSLKHINFVSMKKLGEGKDTLLSRYVFPYTFHVDSGCSCAKIIEWFGVLFGMKVK